MDMLIALGRSENLTLFPYRFGKAAYRHVATLDTALCRANSFPSEKSSPGVSMQVKLIRSSGPGLLVGGPCRISTCALLMEDVGRAEEIRISAGRVSVREIVNVSRRQRSDDFRICFASATLGISN